MLFNYGGLRSFFKEVGFCGSLCVKIQLLTFCSISLKKKAVTFTCGSFSCELKFEVGVYDQCEAGLGLEGFRSSFKGKFDLSLAVGSEFGV
jgi:hypothetical protein